MSFFIAAALAAFFVKGLCQYAGVSKHSEFRGQQCFHFPRRAVARLPEQRHSDMTEPQKPRPKNLLPLTALVLALLIVSGFVLILQNL